MIKRLVNMPITTFLILFISMVFLLAMSKISGEQREGLSRHHFELGDNKRTYLIYKPRSLKNNNEPRPLVFVIHGGGGSDRSMAWLTNFRWHKIAEEEKLYIIYPNALSRYWDFKTGKTSNELETRVNDLSYFKKLIANVIKVLPINEKRIFSTGISRGGMMSYYLACNLPGKIRAIAPFTMPLPIHFKESCTNGPPVGVAIFNGTKDPLVPYNGGPIRYKDLIRDTVISTDDTLVLWHKRNGCPSKPDSTETIDKPGDETSVTKTTWSSCKGAPVVNYRIKSGGHTWPSGPQYFSKKLIGEVSHDIEGADEAWKFFSQFK